MVFQWFSHQIGPPDLRQKTSGHWPRPVSVKGWLTTGRPAYEAHRVVPQHELRAHCTGRDKQGNSAKMITDAAHELGHGEDARVTGPPTAQQKADHQQRLIVKLIDVGEVDCFVRWLDGRLCPCVQISHFGFLSWMGACGTVRPDAENCVHGGD